MRALRLNAGDRCLNVMPLFHVHGLISAALASLLAGGTVICPQQFEAAQFGSWLRELVPTWYTGSPTIHHAVLRAVGKASNSSLEFVRTSSAPISIDTFGALERAFGVSCGRILRND